MTEHVKQRMLFQHGKAIRAWSVSFLDSGSDPRGKREDLAYNMVAEVAVGDAVVRNDFDRVSIFRRPICNATWNGRTWENIVYQGEEGFSWSPAEWERAVLYRCQPFWYRAEFGTDSDPAFVSVSDKPLEGYTLAPMFKNGTDFVYRPCFEMSVTYDDEVCSKAGHVPFTGRADDVRYRLEKGWSESHSETFGDWFSDYLLMLVEFATRDLRSVMPGNCGGTYPVSVHLDDEGNAVGILISENLFFPDDQIELMWDVEDYEEYTTDDVASVSYIPGRGYCVIPYGTYLVNMAQSAKNPRVKKGVAKTGKALMNVTNASSGMADSGKESACVWRGKENPWGNVNSLIADMYYHSPDGVKLEAYCTDKLYEYNGYKQSEYRKCSFTVPSWSGAAYLQAFAVDEDGYHMGPGKLQFQSAQKHMAAKIHHHNTGRVGIRYLCAGGNAQDPVGTHHARFDLFEDDAANMGARWYIEERR